MICTFVCHLFVAVTICKTSMSFNRFFFMQDCKNPCHPLVGPTGIIVTDFIYLIECITGQKYIYLGNGAIERF